MQADDVIADPKEPSDLSQLASAKNSDRRRPDFFKRVFWHPLLRWLDRRVRRAVDGSDLALAVRERLSGVEASLASLHDAVGNLGKMVAAARDRAETRHGEDGVAHARSQSMIAQTLDAVRHEAARDQEAIRQLEGAISGLPAETAAIRLALDDKAALDRARFDSINLSVATLRLGLVTEEGSSLLATLRSTAAEQANKAEEAEEYLNRIDNILIQQGKRAEMTLSYAEALAERSSLVLDDAIAVRSDVGYILCPKQDVSLALSLIENRGCLEPGTRSVVRALLSRGDRAVDVGANVGTLTLPIARSVGREGHVLAIEPTPEVADLLRRTLALNGLAREVSVEEAAASDVHGTFRFETFADTTHNRHLRGEADRSSVIRQVRGVPLDDIVGDPRGIKLVKIDVEGDELLVWRGMKAIAAANADLAVIVEFGPSHLRDNGVSIADWTGEMQQDGFRLWEISEETGLISPLREEGLESVFSLNMLLMRGAPLPQLLGRSDGR